MEQEMNAAMSGMNEALTATVERVAAAAALLEQTVERLETRQSSLSGDVQRIVATIEQHGEPGHREQELERKLHEAEQTITELRAQAGQQSTMKPVAGGRKTLPASMATLLAKQGISTLDQVDAGALDAAMTSLSIEQRIAVKSQLLRAGLMG